jgi:hypothetical protein
LVRLGLCVWEGELPAGEESATPIAARQDLVSCKRRCDVRESKLKSDYKQR